MLVELGERRVNRSEHMSVNFLFLQTRSVHRDSESQIIYITPQEDQLISTVKSPYPFPFPFVFTPIAPAVAVA